MEGGEVMVNGGASNGHGCGVSCGNGLGELCGENGLERVYSENGSRGTSVLEYANGNLADVVLEDWENYWEDVSDRLMISRLVSDSVIKGMVTAVEQACAEQIAAKELEVTSLKERLQAYEVGKSSCSACVCKKRESMRGELNGLRNLAREQFKKAEKEIECATRSNFPKRTSSGTELVGLGEILDEKHSDSWVDVNKTLQCLNTTFDTVCKKVDDLLLCSDTSFCESQQVDKLLAKVQNVATQTVFTTSSKEFEENMLKQEFQLCGVQNMDWLEKFNDVASLGTKLEAIQKSLSMPEAELVSHGSHDLDNLHPKAFGNHVTRPTSLYGENGTVDEPNVHVAESYDFHLFKHMSKEELVAYFTNSITKIKRDHESDLHQMTDSYFSLKREYLKMKGSFVANMKYEEFDALRKKIAQVSSKLENFLSANEQFPALTKSLQSRENMKHRLESLISENRHLRGCLIDKGNELKSLKEQVSNAASEILQHSLAEQNLLKLVESLRSALKESCIKASLSEEIYKSVLREQIAQTRCRSEDLDMELLITRRIYDIILKEAAIPVETASKYGIEDSDIEALLMQGFNALLFTEIIRDSGQQLDNLNQKVLINEEKVACLERKSLEKENELMLEVEDKEKSKQKIRDLRLAMEDKEKLAMDLSLALTKEREQFELALTDLITVREDASRQQMLVTESNRDLESLRLKHVEALDQIEVCKSEINKLDQKLSQTEAELTKVEIERRATFTRIQELHDKLSLSEARELTTKKEMERAANRFSKLFSEFKWKVSGAIKSTSSRYFMQPYV